MRTNLALAGFPEGVLATLTWGEALALAANAAKHGRGLPASLLEGDDDDGGDGETDRDDG